MALRELQEETGITLTREHARMRPKVVSPYVYRRTKAATRTFRHNTPEMVKKANHPKNTPCALPPPKPKTVLEVFASMPSANLFL